MKIKSYSTPEVTICKFVNDSGVCTVGSPINSYDPNDLGTDPDF